MTEESIGEKPRFGTRDEEVVDDWLQCAVFFDLTLYSSV